LLTQHGPYYGVTDDRGALVGFFCFDETARVPAGHEAGALEFATMVRAAD
jgi:hypothetical protein